MPRGSGAAATAAAPPQTQHLATVQHCVFAFDCLTAHLAGAPPPPAQFDDGFCALFVTWNKASSSSGAPRLRGCIGTLEPRRLRDALRDYALTSALRDSRFAPISAREVPALSCGVSLLSGFEPAAGPYDWQVGTHGLIIEFADPRLRARRSATFLPEVAKEQGWTREETVEALVRKAGYSGPVDAALLASLKVTRYSSSKAHATHSEYLALKAASAAAAVAAPASSPPLSPRLRCRNMARDASSRAAAAAAAEDEGGAAAEAAAAAAYA